MEIQVTAAVCDDERELLPHLSRRIRKMFQRYHIDAKTEEFSSADDLLKRQRQTPFEVCFLDIRMPDTDGMTAAGRLLEEYPDLYLIFVSANEEYVFQSFRVHPFAFVRKSCLEEDLNAVVKDISGRLKASREKNCKIYDEMGRVFEISLEDTYYAEAKDKYVNLVTKNQDGFYIRSTLSSLESQLSEYQFVRIHKSFLVNLQTVRAIRYNKVILDEGQELPLSRSRAAEVKRRFCES